MVDAILLIFNRVESMRKEDELPPGQIRHIMDVVARGYRASVPELEEAIAFMEERRVKYGGKKRVTRGKTSVHSLVLTPSHQLGTFLSPKKFPIGCSWLNCYHFFGFNSSVLTLFYVILVVH